jgi:hypothetical protein
MLVTRKGFLVIEIKSCIVQSRHHAFDTSSLSLKDSWHRVNLLSRGHIKSALEILTLSVKVFILEIVYGAK